MRARTLLPAGSLTRASPTPRLPLAARRQDLFWLLERIMPRLHERMGGPKPVHVLGIADPASVPQVAARGGFELGRPDRLHLHPAGLGRRVPGTRSAAAALHGRPLLLPCRTPQPSQARLLHCADVRTIVPQIRQCPPPLQLVTYGCDTFDSCYPTRVGRHGTMLTKDGPLRVVSAPPLAAAPNAASAVELSMQASGQGGRLAWRMRNVPSCTPAPSAARWPHVVQRWQALLLPGVRQKSLTMSERCCCECPPAGQWQV